MPNKYKNKVEYFGETLIDISDTTAEAEDVVEGKKFYDRSGAPQTGSASIPSKTSDLINDSGFITLKDIPVQKETDPTVPAWAKKATKPAYTAREVGALPDTTYIPNKTSDLTNDSGFVTSEDIPTKTSELTNDSGFVTEDKVPIATSDLINDSGFVDDPNYIHTDNNYTTEDKEKLAGVESYVNSVIPKKTSDLTNDSGFITGYTETDPTVPTWAKQPTKPSYTAQEVGALPDDTYIPAKTSDLTNDSGFITREDLPSDTGVVSVNGKDGIVVLDADDVGALPDTTVIPTKTSDLMNDAGFITGYTETDPTVPNWAKQPNKPSYTAAEVGALPDTTYIPENTSDLTNDSGFLTQETDPTVPAWAKEPTKPTYTATEVGALPDDTYIPEKTSDLTNDSGFITGYTETDPTVPSWAKAASKPTYTAAEVGALPDDTAIPSKTSDLTNDSGFITAAEVPPEIFLVTLSSSLTADKTYAQIAAAFADGKTVLVLYNTSKIFYLVYKGADYLVFTRAANDGYDSLKVTSTNTWENTVKAFISTETDPTVPSWAKASSKPTYTAAEVGAAASSHNHNIQDLTNFSARVYDATVSRTKNTVLAAPNGSNGAASFRALVAADIPTLTKSKISDFPTSMTPTAHNHAAGDINSGTLGVARGGTGAASFTANCAIISGSSTTAALTTRAIRNNTATSGAVTADTALITSNTLRYAINRTTSVAAADTGYTTLMARGEGLRNADTNPGVNGAINWTYG